MPKFLKKSVLCLILVLLFLSPAWSAKEGEVVETVLDNGLKVLTVELHNAPIIYSQLSYKVGSRNEKSGITGISHVTEHMMFKGTKKYGKGQVAKIIARNSGVFNAFTDYDMTAYYEQFPKNKIEIALDIESDRMQNCSVNAEELASELKVIKEERRMRTEDSPGAILNEEVQATAYKVHPYHWPVIGWMTDLNSIQPEQVMEYYHTYYTPNNAILTLTGDFDTDQMLKLVKKYFGNIPRGPQVPQMNVVEEPQIAEKTVTFSRADVKNPSVYNYYRVCEYGNPDWVELTVISRILGGGATSRLYKRLVENERIAISAGCRIYPRKDPTLFMVYADVYSDKELPLAEKAIKEEIEKMKKELVSDYEIQKIKNSLRYSEAVEDMKVSGVAGRLSYNETINSWKYIDQKKEELKTFSAQDVKEVMNKYFTEKTLTIGYLLPEKGTKVSKPEKKKTAPEEEEETGEEQGILQNSEIEGRYFYQQEMPEPAGLTSDEILKAAPIAPRVKEHKFPNGITLYMIEDHNYPIFGLTGYIMTGNVVENDKKPGLSLIAGNMMNKGTKKRTHDQLVERKSFLSCGAGIGGGDESISIGAGSLSDIADSTLEILSDMMFNPSFPKLELDKAVTQQIAKLKKAEAGSGWKIARFLFESVYRDHPYGRNSAGKEASLKKITRDDLVKFHKKYFRPENTVMVMYGDLTPEQMISLIARYFGNWKQGKPEKLVGYPEEKPNQRAIKAFPMPEKKQVDIRIGLKWVPKNDKDIDALDIMERILGGSSLSSRLGVNIRDNQGLAYGINCQSKTRLYGGIWFIQSKTEAKNVKQLIRTALKEMERIKTEPVTDEELSDAIKYYQGILPMVVETVDGIAAVIKDQIYYHLPMDDFDTYPDRLAKITKEDVQRVAQKYLDTQNLVITVAGPVDENVLDEFK
jgi:zinc protease